VPTINDVKRDAILFILGGSVSVTDDINYLEYKFWQFVLGGGLSGGGGLPDPGANGLVARTALNTDVARTIIGTTPVAVSNGDGVAGNPTIDVDTFTAAVKGVVPLSGGGTANFLRADGTWTTPPGGSGLPDPGANGIVVRTALNTDVVRSLIAGSTAVAITNGDGVAGNPSIDVVSANLIGIPESGVTGLVADLAAKALDTTVVHLTGNETIAGIKTFSSTISGSIDGNAATVTTVPSLTGDVTSSGNAITVVADAINNTKLANMPANTLKGNNTGVAADPIDLTAAQVKSLLAIANTDVSGLGALATKSAVDLSTADATGILAAARFPALTSDITTVAGSLVTTIASSVVTNAKLATMAAHTIKGNNTAGVANPLDLTGTQVTAELDTFTTALKGLVPASGGGTTNFLRADGTFAAPPGGGGGGLTVVTGQVNFGPSTNQDNLVTVTIPAATIGAGSFPIAFLRGTATADHDPEDYMVEDIEVTVANVVAGVSVDVIAYAPDGSFGLYDVGVAF
jgi:hypothetical protein